MSKCINKLDRNKNIIRCAWCGTDPLYVRYHDKEWGKPVYSDQILFEFLILESAQAGLSWITVLRKRENYRKAFANFDAQKVAEYTEQDVERLLMDQGIIRNRLKINSAINNARLFMEIQQEFGSFSNYIWGFLPDKKPIINTWKDHKNAPARTQLSDRISLELKKRGFKFFGTTICYAYMQATGMINDHIEGCIAR
jgi:DNA-3-methyladenine glycosylase I